MEAKLLKPLLCTKYYTRHFGDLLPLLFKGSPIEQMGKQGLKEVMWLAQSHLTGKGGI